MPFSVCQDSDERTDYLFEKSLSKENLIETFAGVEQVVLKKYELELRDISTVLAFFGLFRVSGFRQEEEN